MSLRACGLRVDTRSPDERALAREIRGNIAASAPAFRCAPCATGKGGDKGMISQRQIDFRREYRSRILGWYDGYFHIALIYAMGAAAFYIYIEHIHNVSGLEWLT